MNKMYRIVKDDPANWKMLQDYTSSILNDCGFETTTEKVVETVRGKVEVDVFAEKKGAYNTAILCECKHWNSSVPQTIVHAFRTVVEDSGASQGIIISKVGFQKGAYEAIEKANISLFTWKEFQDAFKVIYLQNIIDRNFKKGRQLRVKANTVLDIYHKHPFVLRQEEFNSFQLLRDAHSDLILYSFRENYEELDTREITIDDVERGMRRAAMDLKIETHSFKEFFDFIYFRCEEEIEKVNLILTQIRHWLDGKVN